MALSAPSSFALPFAPRGPPSGLPGRRGAVWAGPARSPRLSPPRVKPAAGSPPPFGPAVRRGLCSCSNKPTAERGARARPGGALPELGGQRGRPGPAERGTKWPRPTPGAPPPCRGSPARPPRTWAAPGAPRARWAAAGRCAPRPRGRFRRFRVPAPRAAALPAPEGGREAAAGPPLSMRPRGLGAASGSCAHTRRVPEGCGGAGAAVRTQRRAHSPPAAALQTLFWRSQRLLLGALAHCAVSALLLSPGR